MSLQQISEIQGIKFFDNPASCIGNFEKTHWIKKAISLIQSFGTLFLYALNKINLTLRRVEAQMDPLINVNTKGLSKKRLVVCIHGLNNNPSQFKKIVDEMQKNDLSKTDIFIPRVVEKGNAKLDEMVEPIFKEIKKWGTTNEEKENEEKELVLVGISNGGRIARAIDAKISKLGNSSNVKKLRFVSIVGACKGSDLAKRANEVGLSWVMSKNISEEMPTNSSRNIQLDQEWSNELQNDLTREYTFIASPHDWQVTNYSSSLMKVSDHKAHYAIVPGHGHNSIVNGAAKTLARIILSPKLCLNS